MNSVSLADGRRFPHREIGGGPPLVLLHGWAMSSAVFGEIAGNLQQHFRLLIPDLRGHGRSDPGDGYLLEQFAADLDEWLELLGIERADVFGWSLGGQIALALQRVAPSRVRRLGLIGSTPRFVAAEGWEHGLPKGQVMAMARNVKREYLKTMGEFFDLQFAGEQLPAERYRQIIAFAVRQGSLPQPQVALAALETLRRGDLRPWLADVDCPVLVMHGEQDRICPLGAGAYLADHIPDATFAAVPGVGHAPFMSRMQEVADLWREFLV